MVCELYLNKAAILFIVWLFKMQLYLQFNFTTLLMKIEI